MGWVDGAKQRAFCEQHAPAAEVKRGLCDARMAYSGPSALVFIQVAPSITPLPGYASAALTLDSQVDATSTEFLEGARHSALGNPSHC